MRRGKFVTTLGDLITAPSNTFNDYLEDPNYFCSLKRDISHPNYLDPNVFFGLPREWLNTPMYFNANPRDTDLDAMFREQWEMGIPTPSYLAYDAAHAKERMHDYWVTLHKGQERKTVRGTHVLPSIIIGERTLSLLAVRRLVFHEIARGSQTGSVLPNPEDKLPDVTVSTGDMNMGFYNLQDVLKFLTQRPDKLAWVWNVDAPDYPMDEQTNESTAPLILGHPSAN